MSSPGKSGRRSTGWDSTLFLTMLLQALGVISSDSYYNLSESDFLARMNRLRVGRLSKHGGYAHES